MLVNHVEDVDESIKQMWARLDQAGRDFYHEKSLEKVKADELQNENGYRAFFDEMKDVLIGCVEDREESAKQMWDQLDQDAQNFYVEKHQKQERNKAEIDQD